MSLTPTSERSPTSLAHATVQQENHNKPDNPIDIASFALPLIGVVLGGLIFNETSDLKVLALGGVAVYGGYKLHRERASHVATRVKLCAATTPHEQAVKGLKAEITRLKDENSSLSELQERYVAENLLDVVKRTTPKAAPIVSRVQQLREGLSGKKTQCNLFVPSPQDGGDEVDEFNDSVVYERLGADLIQESPEPIDGVLNIASLRGSDTLALSKSSLNGDADAESLAAHVAEHLDTITLAMIEKMIDENEHRQSQATTKGE